MELLCQGGNGDRVSVHVNKPCQVYDRVYLDLTELLIFCLQTGQQEAWNKSGQP